MIDREQAIWPERFWAQIQEEAGTKRNGRIDMNDYFLSAGKHGTGTGDPWEPEPFQLEMIEDLLSGSATKSQCPECFGTGRNKKGGSCKACRATGRVGVIPPGTSRGPRNAATDGER